MRIALKRAIGVPARIFLVFALLVAVSTVLSGSDAQAIRAPVATITDQDRRAAIDLVRKAREDAAAGRTSQALAKALNAVEIAGRVNPREPLLAIILDDVSKLYRKSARFADALRSAERASAIARAAPSFAPDDRLVVLMDYGVALLDMGRPTLAAGAFAEAETSIPQAKSVSTLASLAENQGTAALTLSHYDEARRRYEQALSLRAKGSPSAGEVARLTLNLAKVENARRRFAEGQDIAARAKAMFEAIVPPDPLGVAEAEIELARIDLGRMDYRASKDRLEAIRARLRAAGAAEGLAYGSATYDLAGLNLVSGEYVLAVPLCNEVLATYEKYLGPSHPAVGQVYHQLALAYQEIGDFQSAEDYYQKSYAIFFAAYGELNQSVASSLLERSRLKIKTGRAQEGLQDIEKSVSILATIPDVGMYDSGIAQVVLGYGLKENGRFAEAKIALEKGLAMLEAEAGRPNADMVPGLNNLAEIELAEGRLDESEAHAAKADAIIAQTTSPAPTELWRSARLRAAIVLARGDLSTALSFGRLNMSKHMARLVDLSRWSTYAAEFSSLEGRLQAEQFVAAAFRAVSRDPTDVALADEAFRTAQFPNLTETARAVSGVAARFNGDSGLERLVAERTALEARRRTAERLLDEALRGADDEARDMKGRYRKQIAEAARLIESLSVQISKDYPTFDSFLAPRAAAVAEVSGQLAPDEAMWMNLTTPTGTYLFFVDADGVEIRRSDAGRGDVEELAARLRATLDINKGPKPYDTEAAFQLYRIMLAPFERKLAAKRHLIVVNDGAMQSIPLSILASAPEPKHLPEQQDYSQVKFIGRQIAISVTPSPSAFVSLRSLRSGGSQSEPFVGFGNPVFRAPPPVLKGTGQRSVPIPAAGRVIDWRAMRGRFQSLPESAGELRRLAELTGGDKSRIFLKADAREARVKAEDLSKARILAFATHGLLANELVSTGAGAATGGGVAEPALVLTLPDLPNEEDDGFLTASEIAGLRLNSDLVILSACNTAGAGGRPGAEGLSGLAQAFFYAGARSLLVSNWSVASNAAVLLTTGLLEESKRELDVRRSEALRRSMERLASGGLGEVFTHPAAWAPFVVVGAD